ncbi:MAG: universal stress protein [archaeon]
MACRLMMMAEKILVPVDGSETMERTITIACELVKKLGGTLTLVHIVSLPISVEDTGLIDPAPLVKVGERILDTAQEIVHKKGCDADRILEVNVGNAGHRIVSVAKENKVTLIVIHARGHSKIATALLGSVCNTVIHSATCQVLIVRP